MNRRELVLAALAPAKGALHTPVQVQKLFFLIDANIRKLVNGPHFAFKAYSYGPFDRDVYEELEAGASQGLVQIVPDRSWRSFALTERGQAVADPLFGGLPAQAKEYITNASGFVRRHSFEELVSAIYKAYPSMRANSVFREPE
jgi:hypothetical protein